MNGPNIVCPRCDGLGMTNTADPFDWPEPWVRCATCSGRGYIEPPSTAGGIVTLSEIATTPEERASVRCQTRGRRGAALSTRGQQRIQHKQRRQDAGDQRRD